MINHPDSLVAQVFKTRYFKSGDIISARLRSNPSFVWRSLYWGRELLREGLRWNIVNQLDVDAGRRGSWAPMLPLSCSDPTQKVATYIKEGHAWNEETTRKDFLPFEAEEIHRTNIQLEGNKDHRYWKFQPKGKYTVSSSYHRGAEVAAKLKEKGIPCGSNSEKT